METIRSLHEAFRESAGYRLLACSLFASALVLVRVVLSGQHFYLFLGWNLILAWIPYLCSLAMAGQRSRWSRRALFAVWLAFFPNAPYIVTDFVHFRNNTAFVWWFDLAMLASFACTGLLLAVISLRMMQDVVQRATNWATGWAFVIATAGLSGLGIYLGRFLRWNSWDILLQPRALSFDLMAQLHTPYLYPRIIGVTIVFAALLLFCYGTFIKMAPPFRKGGKDPGYFG
jgi:uncharacterized membrane protein